MSSHCSAVTLLGRVLFAVTINRKAWHSPTLTGPPSCWLGRVWVW